MNLLVFPRVALVVICRRCTISSAYPSTNGWILHSAFSSCYRRLGCVWLTWNRSMLTWPHLRLCGNEDHPLPTLTRFQAACCQFIHQLLQEMFLCHLLFPGIPQMPLVFYACSWNYLPHPIKYSVDECVQMRFLVLFTIFRAFSGVGSSWSWRSVTRRKQKQGRPGTCGACSSPKLS